MSSADQESPVVVKVTAALRTRDRRVVGEDAWAEQLGTLVVPGVVDPDYLAGTIVLEAPGQDEVVITDDLPPLVQNLCLLGAKSLLEGRDVTFRYWDQPGEVHLTRESGGVRLTGDYLAEALYPERALIVALLACARRAIDVFVAIHRELPAENGDSDAQMDALYREVMALLPAEPATPPEG